MKLCVYTSYVFFSLKLLTDQQKSCIDTKGGSGREAEMVEHYRSLI